VSDGQTDTVDGDGVANAAVVEDRLCKADGEEAAAVVDDQGGDDAFVFDEASEHCQPIHVTMQHLVCYFFFIFLNVPCSRAWPPLSSMTKEKRCLCVRRGQ